ncbi:NEL-type E3 ubiquitin ligase domain-containing protein, partial [Citrobacter sp. JGM124]|uniref:NEL-type E3 ubiquitin ligase domain-containing protein n=1 Tax=Citrobacter sp. JGM124 TaxID=2799789 RepID=UPI001BAAC4A5
LTSLPALPPGLYRLTAGHNQLTSLPALPSELWLLIAGHNQLTSLPELPPGLRSLTVEYNQLASLPALPSGLQSLIVEYNQLTSLPALPPGLYRLTAGQNQLTSLPALPSGLERLDAEHNHLISLPALPSGLRMLTAGHNQLTSLPALPSGLTSLTVNHNQLDRLPVLPSELGSLIARYNQLTSLPGSIADMFSGDCLVELEGNPLSDLTRQALWNITNAPGYSGPLIDWSMVTPPVSQATRALYLAVADWLTLTKGGEPDLTDKWQTFGQENDAASFGAFLARLSKTENCRKDPAFKTQISSWLIQLAEDDSLRAKTFSMATEATSSCEDRVTLALNQMKNVQLVHHAAKGKYDNNYSELVSVGREMFRLDKLEQIARDKVNTLRTLGDYDEIEVYLGYQNKLKEALGLTSVTAGMRFFDISHITDSDLQAAELQVKTAENSQFSEWILQWEPLRNVLEHTYPERWEALCEKKISDYESVYRSLEKELKKNKLNNDTDAERTIGTKAMENAEEKFLTGLRPLRDEMLGGYL